MATGGEEKVGYSLANVGTLTLEKDPDEYPDYISIVVCQDKIVVLDFKTYKVNIHGLHDGKLLASSGILKYDRLESGPRDMCLMDAMTICVIHGDGLIKMMSIDSTDMSRDIKTTKTLRLQGVLLDEYHGVVRFKDSLVVTGVKEGMMYWCIVSLQDGHVDKIHQICEGGGLCQCRVTTKDNIIYISCLVCDKFIYDTGVYGFDILNPSQCKYTYTHQGLQEPTSIVINEDGNIFVCNYGYPDYCIHQLTASCQLVAIFTQGIPRLYALCWDNGHLYGICNGSPDIAVFRPVYQGSHKASEVPVSDERKHSVTVEMAIQIGQGNVKKGQSSVETEMPPSVPFPGDYEDKQDIPAEVLNMDAKSLEMYKLALRDGKEKVYNIRVMVVGQFGVGKTTLTKRLLGKDVKISERKSTEGIDVHIDCCKVTLETGEWISQEKTAVEYSRLQRLVKLLSIQKLESGAEKESQKERGNNFSDDKQADTSVPKVHPKQTKKTDKKPILLPSRKQTQQSIKKVDKRPSKVKSDQTKSNVDMLTSEGVSSESEKMKDAMMEILQLVNKNVEKLEKSIVEYATLGVWDFAGQYAFYTTHQTFLSSRAIYLLVIDLHQQVTDLIKDDQYFHDTEGIKRCKVHDLIEVWLNSIHTCETSPASGIPPVILVGTHVDKVPKRHTFLQLLFEERECLVHVIKIYRTELSNMLQVPHLSSCQKSQQKVIDDYFLKIRYMLGEKPSVLHLMDDIAIDNTQCDPRLEELKRKIFELASKQSHWGEEKPARWLPLEQAMMTLKASGAKVVPLSLIEEINKSGSVTIKDRDELDLFLRFHHEIGTILYFNVEGLRENIVLDPQWLIDALKSLITAEEFMRKNPAIIKSWREFKGKGKLTQELIDGVWTKEKNPEFHDNKDHILLLMEKLNIIAKPRLYSEDGKESKVENYYLAPCMLNEKTPKEVICPKPHPEMESSSVLSYVFKEKFLPAPIFHRLLAACVAKWPISRKKKSENQIYCGCGVFDLDLHSRLVVFFREYIIFAQVTSFGTKERTLSLKQCIEVREFISMTLSKVIGGLGQSLQFELFVRCPKSDGYGVDCLTTVADLQKNVDVPCHFHEKKGTHMINSHEVLKFWFQEGEIQGKPGRYKNLGVHGETDVSRAGDLKAEIDQTEAVFIHRQLGELAKSVGIIKTERTSGTGFRVGLNYIITARHVVESIMVKVSDVQTQHAQHNEYQLNNSNVHIDFSFERNSVPSDMNLVFDFEPEIVYENAYLDTVILKLRHGTKKYPPPLTIVTHSPQDRSQGCYFIGHSGGKIKKTDKYNVVIPTPQVVAAAKNWSMDYINLNGIVSVAGYVNVDGYDGIDDPHRILFHCSFEEGASGAPGLWINPSNGQAYVELMLLHGYPSWYYDQQNKDKIIGIPKAYLIEQGVSMKSIYDDMKTRGAFQQSVCTTIFR